MGAEDTMVSVPLKSLRLLYDCAASYDTRIPEANGRSWVEPIEAVLNAHSVTVTAWDDAMERLTVRAETAEAALEALHAAEPSRATNAKLRGRVTELEAAIRAHRDRWAGRSTETDDALYAVLEGKT